jgi:hypothetical protein
MNTRNNRKIFGRVCLWNYLCILLSLLGNNSVKTFPRQRRIVGGIVFYAIRVVSKESRLLVLPRTSSSTFLLLFVFFPHSSVAFLRMFSSMEFLHTEPDKKYILPLVLFFLNYTRHLVPEGISLLKNHELLRWKESVMLTLVHLRQGNLKTQGEW